MSTDRSRFSGTLSLKNRLNQFQAAMAFWFRGAGLIGAGVTIYFSYRAISEVEGATVIYLRFVAYRFLKFIGEDAQSLLPPLYRLSPPEAQAQIEEVIRYIDAGVFRAVGFGILVATVLLVVGWIVARREHNAQTSDVYVRGAMVTNALELTKRLKSSLGDGIIRIGEVLIPRALEPTHFFLVGRPGAGKTTLINYMLNKIIDRGDRGLIWCAKGEDFLTTHFRDGDQIFCPGDARSLRWTLMSDIASLSDFDLVADALVDETAEKTKVWSGGAKQIISGLLRYCYVSGKRTNRQVWDVFCGGMSEWHTFLSATPGCGTAAGLIENPKSQTCVSFYVTVCLYVLPFRLLAEIDGDFSIQRWITEGAGRIYLPSNDRIAKSLSPLHSLFIAITSTYHLCLPNDRDRRIWYMLDELPSLEPLRNLTKWLNTGRSKGLCAVIGTQSFAYLDLKYSEHERQAIRNACRTSVIFSVADTETAEKLADDIGKREIEQSRQNLSIGFLDTKDSVTSMNQKVIENLYIPDEIRDLPDLTAIIKILGFPVVEVQLRHRKYDKITEEFVEDPKLDLKSYVLAYEQLATKVEEMAKNQKLKEEVEKTSKMAAKNASFVDSSSTEGSESHDLSAISNDF
ncbi:type IV secretion system DNA-binding domain-containing protein [Geobacter anodireducens]